LPPGVEAAVSKEPDGEAAAGSAGVPPASSAGFEIDFPAGAGVVALVVFTGVATDVFTGAALGVFAGETVVAGLAGALAAGAWATAYEPHIAIDSVNNMNDAEAVFKTVFITESCPFSKPASQTDQISKSEL